MTELQNGAWVLCEACGPGNYWCRVHQMHSPDCACPPIEEWVRQGKWPYEETPSMGSEPAPRVYFVELRRKNVLSGRWGAWEFWGTHFLRRQDARRDEDRGRQTHPEKDICEFRTVTFRRDKS